MASEKFQLGLVQMSASPDPGRNLQHAIDRARDAARKGAQIVCLQELFRSPYFCQTEDASCFDLAEPIPGPTTEALAGAAAAHGVAIVGSIFERACITTLP